MLALESIMDRMLGRGAVLRGARIPELLPDLRTPIAAAEYVVFDTELTGMRSRKDSVVSIGAVRMAGSTILPGNISTGSCSPAPRSPGRVS